MSENHNANTQVFASKATATNFPILERLPEMSHVDLRLMLVLSPEDLQGSGVKERIAIERQNKNYEITDSQYQDYINNPANNIDLAAITREAFERVHPNHADLIAPDLDFNVLGQNLISGGASNTFIDQDITIDDVFVFVTTTPYADATKQELAAEMVSALSPADFERLPGTNEDWRNAVLIHEVNHSTGHSNHGLSMEVTADRKMNEEWYEHFNHKAQGTSLLPEAHHHMRALESFGNPFSGFSHVVNAAIQINGEGPAPKGSERMFAEQLGAVKDRTTLQMSKSLDTLHAYTDPTTNMLAGRPIYDGYPLAIITKEEESALVKLLGASDMTPESFDAILNQLSENTLNTLIEGANNMARGDGQKQALANPDLLYATTYNMYVNGDYDDLPIGKQYAYEYLVAAHKMSSYGDDPYTTKDFDQSAVKPPSFDENGQAMEMNTPKYETTAAVLSTR